MEAEGESRVKSWRGRRGLVTGGLRDLLKSRSWNPGREGPTPRSSGATWVNEEEGLILGTGNGTSGLVLGKSPEAVSRVGPEG